MVKCDSAFATRFALPMVLSVAAVMLLWLSIVENAWMAFVFAVVHGVFFGAQQPLNQIAFPDYFGRWSVGAIRGITSPVQFGLNAIGAPIATLVFDARGSFDLIFIIFSVQLLIASALILAAKPPRKQTDDGHTPSLEVHPKAQMRPPHQPARFRSRPRHPTPPDSSLVQSQQATQNLFGVRPESRRGDLHAHAAIRPAPRPAVQVPRAHFIVVNRLVEPTRLQVRIVDHVQHFLHRRGRHALLPDSVQTRPA